MTGAVAPGRVAALTDVERRALHLTCLVALGAAWGWFLYGADSPWGHRRAHDVLIVGWSSYLASVAIWQVMTVAMMTPAVAPWAVTFGSLLGGRGRASSRLGTIGTFAAGYFTAWLGFSAAAAAVQLGAGIGVRGAEAGGTWRVVAGLTLVLAGVYQFSPFKRACLAHCRNPLSFLLARWRNGPAAAFRLGLAHGWYCLGCCWALMATALALGVMNLVWMVVLTVVVSIEQVAPGGRLVGRAVGVGLIVAGLLSAGGWSLR